MKPVPYLLIWWKDHLYTSEFSNTDKVEYTVWEH